MLSNRQIKEVRRRQKAETGKSPYHSKRAITGVLDVTCPSATRILL
jgi:hypothetical protein